MLNQILKEMGCLVDTPTELVPSLVSGDLIVRNISEPNKVSVMTLARADCSSYSRSDIASKFNMITKKN